MAMTFRDIKGSPLTAAEVDDNFRTLQAAIDEVATNVPVGVSITGFTVTGTTFKVQLSDGSFRGPFDLPVAPAWNWRGNLAVNTVYQDFDVFSFQNNSTDDGVYLVIGAYLSPMDLLDFDPAAVADDTEGGPALEKMLGTVNETVLVFDISDSFTLSSSEVGYYIRHIGPDPIAIYVTEDDTIPIGAVYTFRWADEGSVTFVEDGVVIDTPETLSLRKHGSSGTLVKVGALAWELAGDLQLLPESTEGA